MRLSRSTATELEKQLACQLWFCPFLAAKPAALARFHWVFRNSAIRSRLVTSAFLLPLPVSINRQEGGLRLAAPYRACCFWCEERPERGDPRWLRSWIIVPPLQGLQPTTAAQNKNNPAAVLGRSRFWFGRTHPLQHDEPSPNSWRLDRVPLLST